MVTIAVVLVFIGTVLGVMALLVLLIPTPDPHAVRVQKIQAAAAGTGAIPLTAGRRQGSVGTWVQRIAEQLGRSMPSQSPKAQAKGRNLLVQAGYRKASAGLTFQGGRILLAALLPMMFLLVAPYLKGWTGAHRMVAILGLVALGLFFASLVAAMANQAETGGDLRRSTQRPRSHGRLRRGRLGH